jgi:hypothetical protein
MKFRFEAKIYKVGINPCVKVPSTITKKMSPVKGYIRVKGTINRHSFFQTLMPVKNEGYRLYVNRPMLKGGKTKTGKKASFTIEQDLTSRVWKVPMNKAFGRKLKENNALPAFKKLTPSRQKEILRYLNSLKSKESLQRNIGLVIRGLQKTGSAPLFRL